MKWSVNILDILNYFAKLLCLFYPLKMYTDIRELANFLARFFHLRVPKLKFGMFCEHLANIGLLRFQPYWDVKRQKQDEEKRVIRISRDFADEIITEASTATAVRLQELANCLPVCLNLYVNPGEVFFTTSDNSPPVTIWVDSVNEDHNNEKKHKSSLVLPPRPPSLLSTILPQMPAPIQPLCNLFPSLNMMNSNARAYHGQNCGFGGSKVGLFAVSTRFRIWPTTACWMRASIWSWFTRMSLDMRSPTRTSGFFAS